MDTMAHEAARDAVACVSLLLLEACRFGALAGGDDDRSLRDSAEPPTSACCGLA